MKTQGWILSTYIKSQAWWTVCKPNPGSGGEDRRISESSRSSQSRQVVSTGFSGEQLRKIPSVDLQPPHLHRHVHVCTHAYHTMYTAHTYTNRHTTHESTHAHIHTMETCIHTCEHANTCIPHTSITHTHMQTHAYHTHAQTCIPHTMHQPIHIYILQTHAYTSTHTYTHYT